MTDSMSHNPCVTWPTASSHDLAAYDRLLGQEVIQEHDVYWRRVRPFFYRPLLTFRAYPSASIVVPRAARWGGFQHAVPTEESCNSHLNLLMFENRLDYSVRDLDYNRRRQVRIAETKFAIRPMKDVAEFAQKAYPVYLSFHERTQYVYGARRRERDYFMRWADGLFQLSNLVILGGYQGDELHGISISLRVEDTLIYATFFCDSDSLRGNLSDIMLHEVRHSASSCREISHIYAGTYKGKNDDFYLLRGCECVRIPTRLHLNPAASFLLRHFMPGYHARLLGSNGPSPHESHRAR